MQKVKSQVSDLPWNSGLSGRLFPHPFSGKTKYFSVSYHYIYPYLEQNHPEKNSAKNISFPAKELKNSKNCIIFTEDVSVPADHNIKYQEKK